MKNLSVLVRLLVFVYVCGAGESITRFGHQYTYEDSSEPNQRHERRSQHVIVEAPSSADSFWSAVGLTESSEDDPSRFGPTDEDIIPEEEPKSEHDNGELPGLAPPPEKPITNADLGASLERLAGQVDNLVSELKSQQDKIAELENVNKKLHEKVDLIEQQVKTNNLVFFNVPESRHENHKTTQQKVLQLLNKVMRVRTNGADIAMALRADGNSSSGRPIVVKFTNFATKMRVMANKNRLGRSNVKIVADYSEEVSRRRSELVPHMHNLRSQGHHVFLVYDKLMVDGVLKTLQELPPQPLDVLDPSFIRRAPCEDSETTTEEQPSNPDEQVEEVEGVTPPQEDYDEYSE